MTYVPRRLWYDADDKEREYVSQDEILRRPEPLVVLGEPGMGKSALLGELGKAAGGGLCTARQLINRPDPRSLIGDARMIIIDALDEVSARNEGYAVDLVLQKLGVLGYPRFVLACRVADWQAATSVATIREQYRVAPLQLHLEPLSRRDQLTVLSRQVGEPRARELIEHFEAYGLDFLGNPQSLELIARLPRNEPLPESSGSLFQLAVEKLRVEHREGLGQQEVPRDTALSAAGAAFAALILTGNSTICRTGQANLEEGEVPFAEVDSLADGNLQRVLGTRLFSGGNDSFSYWHRRIGEFLGAAWLSARADTREKRRRLLSLFHSQGLVPASLRGIHAWLARNANFTDVVIRADPMGVIEYGDADVLTPAQAGVLFEALEDLVRRNPWFRQRGVARAGALVSAPMFEEVIQVIRNREAPFALRSLLLEQLDDDKRAEPYRETLQQLMLDPADAFALRWKAGAAMVALVQNDWPALVESLRQQACRDSVRLAYEMMQLNGLQLFSDQQVVDVVLSYSGLMLSPWPREQVDIIAARFWDLPKSIPQGRLDGVLDALANNLAELLPERAGIEHNDLIDALHGCIIRRLEVGPVEPLRLWSWLRPMSVYFGYHRDNAKILAEHLRALSETRRAIQQQVLIYDSDESIWSKYVALSRASNGLTPDEADVVVLIGALDPAAIEGEQLIDILSLIPHDEERGSTARRAAEQFVAGDNTLRERIARLASPPVPDWQLEQEQDRQQQAAEQAARIEEAQRAHLDNIEQMRAGEFRWLHAAAQAYLKRLYDLGDGVPAHERVAEWLGPELAVAAHEGFEAFLTSHPPRPTATRMALSYAAGRRYYAGDIIVAALAERLRLRADPFGDLSDERLMAGLFELWEGRIDDYAGLPGLADRLEADLRSRGVWGVAVRLFIVAQLRRRKTHVDRLYEFMRAAIDADLATSLAIEWLQTFPDLPAAVEAELIDRVLHSPRRAELLPIGDARRTAPMDDERRRNWDAVQILIDIDAAVVRLDSTIESELLWHIRRRLLGNRTDERSVFATVPRQLLWIIGTFRPLWPFRDRPNRVTTGDINPWDATGFLADLIALLGENTSDAAVAAMSALVDAPSDGYTDYIRSVAAEQQRKQVEQTYTPPTIEEIAAILNGGPPGGATDLQAIMLENLEVAQAMLRGSDVDWYRGFFREDGRHKNEESCRDELIKMLRSIDGRLEYIPESHGADDKRVDIVARAGARPILPIEIKGQWHRDLWTAADEQLDHLYVTDWRADRGIYLVLWFGEGTTIVGPPNGIDLPHSPGELAQALIASSRAAQSGRVDIVILDLTRPTIA